MLAEDTCKYCSRSCTSTCPPYGFVKGQNDLAMCPLIVIAMALSDLLDKAATGWGHVADVQSNEVRVAFYCSVTVVGHRKLS